ncbi:MAG: hypothetical protein ABI740_00445 [Alphaproteobacteria bacterium]
MARLIGAILGLYLLAAVAVAAGGAYGLSANLSPRAYACPENELAIASGAPARGTTGPPNRPLVLGLRALIWPSSLFRAVEAGASPVDWFTLRYDWAPDACKAGPGMVVPQSMRV